jgi:hypothetical protein
MDAVHRLDVGRCEVGSRLRYSRPLPRGSLGEDGPGWPESPQRREGSTCRGDPVKRRATIDGGASVGVRDHRDNWLVAAKRS